MIRRIFVFAFLVAIVNASRLTKKTKPLPTTLKANFSPLALNATAANYGDAISQFLQAWKQMIPCGYAEDNIPILAPLTHDFSSFNFSKGETSFVGNSSNIRISGLNNFIVLSGSFNVSTQKAKFDILFPEIQILGSFAVEGVMSMLGFAFPVREVSLLNERFQQLRFVGEYTFGQSLINPTGLRISDFHLQFYLADVKIDNWDILWNISLNELSNTWARQIISLATKLVQPNVDMLLSLDAIPIINDMLSAVNLDQLSQFLVNSANRWNSANCQVQA
ncbi:uncharacterized protein LOC117573606 [Drosophila albomicans]|uniref:Uncharacterized protein LOC117573606 n=1 Tax=Drosophila albomicans TaxID=7291 RepID=A0A6P8XIS5_DROAB|nr:uncharacterized protein LOC117573606 [Drosophila albomicans]